MKKLIFALLLGLSVALPVSAYAYVVKPGDTLWGLYGSNWRTVAQQNGISDPRKLQVGTVLPEPTNQGLVGQMLGSVIPVSPALIDTYLASGIAPGDTSMTLANGTTRAGTTLSGYMCFTIDVNTPVVEYVCGTASGTAVTGLLRGIDFTNPNTTSSALAFSHRRFASIQISDYPLLTLLSRMLNGVDSIPGKLELDQIPYTTTTSDPLLPGDLIPLSFLTTVTTTGCANASETVRGCTEIASTNEAKASTVTDTGGTGAKLVIPPTVFQGEGDHHYINEYMFGESITQSYPVLYMSSSGKWFMAHGNVQAEIDRIGAVGYIGTSNTTTAFPVYGPGSHIAGTNLSGLTPGAPIYLGDDSRGSATPGTIRKVVGRAVKSDSWIFMPDVETPTSTAGTAFTPIMSNASGTLSIDLYSGVTQSYTAGESINASSAPIAVYLSSTDGLIYKTASGAVTTTFPFIGFAVLGQNKTAGQSISVQFAGNVSGFTGMTTGSIYYVSTAGTVSSTAGTINYKIGRALSPTVLFIEKGSKVYSGTTSFTSTASTVITVGFQPSKVTINASNRTALQISSNGGWTANGGNFAAYVPQVGTAGGVSTGNAWYTADGGGVLHTGTVTSLTATGFTLSNTETSGADTVDLVWTASE